MISKLKLVETRAASIVNPYGIFSMMLLLVALYMLFADKNSLPGPLKTLSPVMFYSIIGLLFINGFFALKRSLAKPEEIGTLNVDETRQKIVIEVDLDKHEINFADINRVDFDIRGYKSLTDNLYGNNNFVEIFYDLSTQRERHEFILESPTDMYILKNAFGSIRNANPRVMINY